MVDVGQGRILRCVIATGDWSLVVDYDGEPNGLTLDRDGQLLVADYKNGIVRSISGDSFLLTMQLACDLQTNQVRPHLSRKNMERFKGPNDLIVADNGDLCKFDAWKSRLTLDFTDQGQTGMSDQSGVVYRLNVDGKLDTLLFNGISPNGLVLSPDQKVHQPSEPGTALIAGAICCNDQRQ